MRPPPRLTVGEWSDQRRKIPVGTSPEPGQWRSRPYQRPVLDALSDPRIRGVVYIAPSQGGGKTEILLNWAGYTADVDPCPMLIVEPNIDMAKALSKDRLAKMVAATPTLRSRVMVPKSRDSANTVLHKAFHGGHWTLVGANSASGLAMRPIRRLACDEVDRYGASAGTEGDPVSLAQARTSAFWNAQQFFPTSPGRKSASRSFRLWGQTDKRLYVLACPDCGHEQFPKWKQVTWERDELGRDLPKTAIYACEACGSAWDDRKRWQAARRARYKPTGDFEGWAGFWVHGLALLGKRLSEFVELYLKAKGNPEEELAFYNTRLGEWYDDQDAESMDSGALATRRETWREVKPGGEVPEGVVVVTVFADVQRAPARLEYEVVGWGHGDESWSLRYDVIPGDIKTDPNVLAELDRVFLQEYVLPGGLRIWPRACGVDAGYATQTVYEWCKPRIRRLLPDGRSQFVFATIGRATHGRPVWTAPALVKAHRATRDLWIIGTNAAKGQVLGRLGIVEPGPGYCHFPADRGIGWFEGLVSEHEVTKGNQRVYELKKKGQPNEPLDCRVGAYAVLVGVQAAPFGLSIEAEAQAIADWKAAQDPVVRRIAQEAAGAPKSKPGGGSWLGDTSGWLR